MTGSPSMGVVSLANASKRIAAMVGTRWSFYDPANHLIAESRLNQTGQSGIGYNYVWFAGRPIAQVDDSGTHWTFADHLGTPLIQTDGSHMISWRAEYEPSGLILTMRGQNYHQPLRLPGMEAEQLSGDTTNNAKPDVDTSRFYGGNRWYQAQWGTIHTTRSAGIGRGNKYVSVRRQ